MKTVEQAPSSGRPDMDLAANRLPSTDALDGTDLVLELDDGARLDLRLRAGVAEWALADDPAVRTRGRDPYDAVEIRSGMFFLDLSTGAGTRAISIVLDRGRARAVALVNDLLDSGTCVRVAARASAARVAGNERYEPIQTTSELTGRRLFCEYSDDVALEHIYLNSRAVGWQWLKAPRVELAHEAGIDIATFWKVDDGLYLLRGLGDGEAALTLLLDFERRRNVGRLFGQGYAGRLDVRCGAKLTLLGATEYTGCRPPA